LSIRPVYTPTWRIQVGEINPIAHQTTTNNIFSELIDRR
jgi:hypothetical protein